MQYQTEKKLIDTIIESTGSRYQTTITEEGKPLSNVAVVFIACLS